MMQQREFDEKEIASQWWKDPLVLYLNERLANVLIHRYQSDLNKTGTKNLDFGCGAGVFTNIVKEKCGNSLITGVDLSPAMIEVYRERFPDEEAFCMNVTESDQGDLCNKKFDFIFCCYVLHHCEDPPKMVQVLSSYLAPGGRLVFGEFYPSDREKAPKEFFSKGDLTKWLLDSGLVDVHEDLAFDCSGEEIPKSTFHSDHENHVFQVVVYAEGTKHAE